MDQLLGELRLLGKAAPERAGVRGRIARALFNCVRDADARRLPSRGDPLLDELRVLARSHTDDFAIRGPLARALLLRFERATGLGDQTEQAALLQESRELACSYSAPSGLPCSEAKNPKLTANPGVNFRSLERA